MSTPTKECRYLCSELISVHYEDRFGGTNQAVVNLEEISSTAATILADKKLEPGRPISLRAKQHRLHGIVESSDFDATLGWFVKIALDSDSRWHGRLFVPEHFIALCASTSLVTAA